VCPTTPQKHVQTLNAHSTVPGARLRRHGEVSSPTRSVPAPNGGGSVDAHRP
jgi:hypothetical protein